MPVLKPPHPLSQHLRGHTTIFLAGSIDNGKAENWQERVEAHFADQPGILLLNPRREDWNPDWKQEFQDPPFYQQVNWELNCLDRADRILLYFAPDSKAPISLLELGLYAASGKVSICCPVGYWRRGNVEVVAERYGIPFYDSLEEMLRLEYSA